MKYMKTLIGAFVATVLLATTAFAGDLKSPQFDKTSLLGFGTTNAENWTLSLAGGGATTTTGDSQTAFGLNLQLGHADTIFVPGEVGIRQGLNWASPSGGNWALSTAIYQDWKLLSYKSLDIYVGGNVEMLYGNRTLGWTLSPEVETRLWLKKGVYTYGRVEYAFDISDSSLKSQDTFRYVIGLGFKF